MFPAITGAHVLLYSDKPEADRAFFRDILGFRQWTPAAAGSFSRCLPPKSGFTPRTASDVSSTADGNFLARPLLDVRRPVGTCEVFAG
jgi:catechol 2,3-dioxygenase-like lactoylglutathione lyase family enzyme